MSIQNVTIIGTGNVAWHFSKLLFESGICIPQVYGRDIEKATLLAKRVGARATNTTENLIDNDGIYLLAVSDDSLHEVAEKIYKPGRILIHTSGNTNVSAIRFEDAPCGVLYPMQTFTKDVEVQASEIVFFITASTSQVENDLTQLAKKISEHVHIVTDYQRSVLHLSAVWVNNFTNSMYIIASELLNENGLDFKLLMPLIEQSVKKLKYINPQQSQTGPAKRGDVKTLEKHVALMGKHPDLINIYKQLSEYILHTYRK